MKILVRHWLFFYSEILEVFKRKFLKLKGTFSIDIFPFPGGRRFHFYDPAGNDLAVWSEKS